MKTAEKLSENDKIYGKLVFDNIDFCFFVVIQFNAGI